jgi:hypothetical protein
MRRPKFTTRRAVILGVLLLLAAGIAAPYLRADQFGGRIRQALEQALGRKIEIGSVRFNLFLGPGFTLRDVVIHDDPAVGIEPLAQVGSIEAQVSLLDLLRGRLAFSSLRLEQPSVNLVKTAAGAWNFQPLINQAITAALPAIAVRGGRLNFKLGNVKTVFYFSNTDLDLRPARTPGDAFDLSFSGEPTRTDRTARGFGTLSGRGSWRPGSSANGSLELDLNLEKSSLGELVTLMHGQDIGVHGQVSGQAKLRGPASALDVTGTLLLGDIHRWDLLPPYAAGGPLNFRGKLDLIGQDLLLETVPGPSALAVRLRASDYLVHPRWVAAVSLNRFPIPPLVDVARHMGALLAGSVQTDGSVFGVVSYSSDTGLQGAIALNGVSIAAAGSAPVRFDEAQLVLDGNRVSFAPASVSLGDRDKALLEFDYTLDTQKLDLKLSTDSMSIAALQSEGGPLPGLAKPSFVAQLRGGNWQGLLRYRPGADSPGQWSGAIRLEGVSLPLPGFAQPLELLSANLSFQDDALLADHIRAVFGETEIQGEYTYRPKAVRPHVISCRIAKLRASELEALLAPTLRRPQSFLARTLRFQRAPAPDWLAARRLEGAVEIGTLTLAGETFESVSLKFFWDGPVLDVPRFQARVEGGSVDGYLSADFRGPAPVYQVAARVDSVDWRGGKLEGDGSLATSGLGEDLYWNLRAEGWFHSSSPKLGENLDFRALSGAWDLRWERKQPRLQLTGLRLSAGQDTYTGQGASLDDQQLQLDFSQGEKRLRFTGSLKPIRLEPAENR